MAEFTAMPGSPIETIIVNKLTDNFFEADALDLVTERFNNAQSYANTAFSSALNVFSKIQQMAGEIEDIPIDTMLEDYNLNTPDWTAFVLPNPSDYNINTRELTPPSINFNWNDESIYTSDLLVQLISKCATDMTSGTGISASVEDDMIDRESERDALINAEARSQVETEWAEYGWDMPDGVLGYNVVQIEDTYQNKKLDKSRDIRVESFNLAQKNIQFAMSTADSLEGKLESYQTGMIQRKLEAAKYIVDTAIQVFRTTVEYLMSKIKIFEAVVDSFKARMIAESEKVKLDVTVFDAKVKQVLGRAQVIISKAQLLITQYVEQNKLRLTALEEAGKIASQVAGAALMGVSAQAHVSSSDQFSASGQVSYQGQESITINESTD